MTQDSRANILSSLTQSWRHFHHATVNGLSSNQADTNTAQTKDIMKCPAKPASLPVQAFQPSALLPDRVSSRFSSLTCLFRLTCALLQILFQ
ncbi:hypothetical protein Bbelb_349010, partial [Branchiostoma belcheri]